MKKFAKNRMKELFQFDMKKEKKIHSYLYTQIPKKSLKDIDEDVRFTRYKDWKDYIVARYKKYNKDSLIEFDKYINVILQEGYAINSYAQCIATTYFSLIISIFMTKMIELTSDNIGAILTCVLIFPAMIVFIVIKGYEMYTGGSELVLFLNDVKGIIEELTEESDKNKL